MDGADSCHLRQHQPKLALGAALKRPLADTADWQQSYDPAIDIPSMAQTVESWFFRDRDLVFLAFRSA